MIKQRLFATVFAALLATLSFGAAAQLADKKTLTLEAAKKIAAAAESEAQKNKWNVVIVVVDDGGHLVYLQRMDTTQTGSVDVAINKAYTARAFDLSTAELAANAQPGGPFYGIQESNKGKVMIFAGGVPLKRDGEIVGAVGVSGGDEEQDTTVAEAAAEAF